MKPRDFRLGTLVIYAGVCLLVAGYWGTAGSLGMIAGAVCQLAWTLSVEHAMRSVDDDPIADRH